jgi:elongation factor P
MFSASDLKKGLKVEVDGSPWVISEFDFCKPGKGTALYRCKLKNLINGNTMDRTYRPTDKIDKPNLEEREMYYSYPEGEFFVFSDSESYEEIRINKSALGEKAPFLIENTLVSAVFFNGSPIDITLPTFVEKKIVECEPGVKGDTATSAMKSATLDNGVTISVPLFIKMGDVVRIDTRTCQYAERVNKA